MCAIIGAISATENAISLENFNNARDCMHYRGPNAANTYTNAHVALGHRRLSIIDLTESANQPMHLAERYTVVFNGEIYNYLQLKEMLRAKGCTFVTQSDTEVVLHLYAMYGNEMMHYLEGMFSFAIWDNVSKALLLVRDRLGIKPLYYIRWQNIILFASEPKAFFVYGVPLQFNNNTVTEFQFYRHVSGANTLFENIYQILPGHYAIIKNFSTITINRWWNIKDKIQHHPVISNPQEWFTNTFDASVKKHMISDVPVGILLSGGLDSSSIGASLYKQQFTGLSSFTMGFENYVNNESNEAALLATTYNLQHHNYYLTNNNLIDALDVCNVVNDTPLVHQNEPHIYHIANNAKHTITVLLSGEGADEILGGYVRYKPLKYAPYYSQIEMLLQCIPTKQNTRLEKLKQYFKAKNTNELLFTNALHWYANDFKQLGVHINNIDTSYKELIIKEAQALYPNRYQRQMMYVDVHTYLTTLNERNDRSTMAASIECRIPFLDHHLVEGLGTLQDEWFFSKGQSKAILREAYKKELPTKILQHRKVGFSVPWMQLIMQNEKLRYEWDNFHKSDACKMGIYSQLQIQALKKSTQLQTNIRLQQFLLSIFFMSMWYNAYTKKYTSIK